MTEKRWNNGRPNIEKLLSFGFVKCENVYFYHCDLLGGQMKMNVAVGESGAVSVKVIDCATDEEYVLHRVASAEGAFVGQVKLEYEAVLDEIAEKCLDAEVFQSEQTKQVIAYVREAYGDELEYLWQKFPDNAVVRRKDNQKWYAAILTVSRRKLGLDSDETVEILDLRVSPEEMTVMIDHVKYFPGYHMNKKHWFTVCLDGSLSLEEIFRRIDASYVLARK